MERNMETAYLYGNFIRRNSESFQRGVFFSCVNDIGQFKLIDRSMGLQKQEIYFCSNALDILVLDLYNTARPIQFQVFRETFFTTSQYLIYIIRPGLSACLKVFEETFSTEGIRFSGISNCHHSQKLIEMDLQCV